MSDSTSTIRVSNHNNWPAVELFPCERDLIQKMATHNIQQIFVTAKLKPDDKDEPFNAAVGHILDCLDCLPQRPDAAFDSLYKVIDQNLNIFEKPSRSRMQAMADHFFSVHPTEWTVITEFLSEHIPQQTADYAASRILDCQIESNPPHSEHMKKRAERSLGKQRYKDFCKKFLITAPDTPELFLSLNYEDRRNAGRLMCLFFRQSAPLKKIPKNPDDASSTLNLSNPANLLLPKEKLTSLLEILLSTYRHERFHGEAFSPFRSSKASIKTYAHAYYALIVAYIIVLGVLESQNKGGTSMASIVDVTRKSMKSISSFFEDALNK